jgi:hypothetical protein
VYKLSKALYKYVMGSVGKTLYTLKHVNDLLLVQIYVDDIIFGGSSHVLVSSFSPMFIHCFGRILLTECPFDPIFLPLPS